MAKLMNEDDDADYDYKRYESCDQRKVPVMELAIVL
jgi:hypothetical protein